MTNKIEERLRLYGKFPPAVKYLAVSRSGYIILKVAFKRHAEYGRTRTYFTYFWDRMYYWYYRLFTHLIIANFIAYNYYKLYLWTQHIYNI